MSGTEEIERVCSAAAGPALRDVWTFDRESETCAYMRADVRERVADHDTRPFIDNERYGFITRLTYDDLTYAKYEFTVRGFDCFRSFRTFLEDEDGEPLGVLVSVDRDADVEFGDLYAALVSLPGFSEPTWDSASSAPGDDDSGSCEDGVSESAD